MKQYTKDELQHFLTQYGITEISEFTMEDSSHGEDDIRHNYIIDHRYVLRVNSVPVMTEDRFQEINRLIQRYLDFGIQAPLFICGTDGHFIHKDGDLILYLSEYIDLEIVNTLLESQPEQEEQLKQELNKQNLSLIASFAEKYKGQDLSSYYSMYSLFTLCPYDQLEGIDEKQQNLNKFADTLTQIGETTLADRLVQENEKLRSILLPIYQELPKCVFQGDENFSNVCVNEKQEICGLFDFNMSGTDVNANYFANVANLLNPVLTKDVFDSLTPSEALDEMLAYLKQTTKIMQTNYTFTEQEFMAYQYYAKIVLFSGWPNVGSFLGYFKDEKSKQPCLELIHLILDLDMTSVFA